MKSLKLNTKRRWSVKDLWQIFFFFGSVIDYLWHYGVNEFKRVENRRGRIQIYKNTISIPARHNNSFRRQPDFLGERYLRLHYIPGTTTLLSESITLFITIVLLLIQLKLTEEKKWSELSPLSDTFLTLPPFVTLADSVLAKCRGFQICCANDHSRR